MATQDKIVPVKINPIILYPLLFAFLHKNTTKTILMNVTVLIGKANAKKKPIC